MKSLYFNNKSNLVWFVPALLSASKMCFFRFHSLEWLHHLSKKDTVEMCACFFTNVNRLTSIRLSYKRSALKEDACAAKLFRWMPDWIFRANITLNRPFLVLISSMCNKQNVERTSLPRYWSYIGMCCYRWNDSTRHSFFGWRFRRSGCETTSSAFVMCLLIEFS